MATAKDPTSFLQIKLPLIPPSVVAPLSRALGWAFTAPVAAAWLSLAALVQLLFWLRVAPGRDLGLGTLDAAGFALLLVVSTLGGLVHELGHATAATRFGCRRIQIGWGVYLIYTVLWTDVSDAWKLPRRQRVVIDLAGMYFQSVVLLALLVAFALGHDARLLVIFAFVQIEILANLNPFLRLDGYWVVSDALGLVNLRQRQLDWGLAVLRRALGRPGPAPSDGGLFLPLYTLAGLAFSVVMLGVTYRFAVQSLLATLPATLARLSNHAADHAWLALGGGALELLWRSLVLAGLAIAAVRFVRGLAAGLRRLA